MKKKAKTVTPVSQTALETSETIRTVSLEGIHTLHAVKQIATWRVTRKIDPKSGTPYANHVSKVKVSERFIPMDFSLQEISPEELAERRVKNVPSFVFQQNEKLYFTEIPETLNVYASSILGTHLCTFPEKECCKFSAASDENGGCAKVRNFSKCIELYPWITEGYETFGTLLDSFGVTKCSHYKMISSKKGSVSHKILTQHLAALVAFAEPLPSEGLL